MEMATASVASELKNALAGVRVISPGERVDGNSFEAWVDLDVEAWTGRSGRASGRLDGVTVTADVFVRRDGDAYRSRELADRARGAFDGATVTVLNFDESSRPAVGFVRLGEAVVRELSRSGAVRQELSRVTLTWRGVAQPLVNS